MTSALNSIPNSSGVSSVLNLFSFCFSYLKNARPISGSSHMVTSLIKPQMGPSLLSRTPLLLIAAGAFAAVGAAYLIAAKVIFRKTPTTPPPALPGRAEPVPPTPAPGPAGANSGAGAGSLEPQPVVHPVNRAGGLSLVVDQSGAGLSPAPFVPAAQIDGADAKSLPSQPVVHPVNRAGGLSLVVDQSGAGLSPAPFVPAAQIVGADAKSHSPVDAPVQPGSAPLPSLEPKNTLATDEELVPQDSPPRTSSSPERSSSGSENETESRPPSPPQASAVERLVGAVTYFISTGRHFTKWTKYRLIQKQLEDFARSKNINFCIPELGASDVENNITTAWNELIKALLQPTSFTTADEQYRKTVECLRQTRQLLSSSDEATQEKFAIQLQFIRELSYVRFAGIELFPYCQQLIEHATGVPLPANLTLPTFQTALKHRTTVLKRPAGSTAMNPVACEANKARGTLNIGFDPLLKTSNIPYRDGLISANGRSTLILWHGTPVQQDDPYGLAFDLLAGALSYIPYVGKLITDGNPVSSPPVVNADYVTFIEEAAQQKQKILHVILENGTRKRLGDESGRVRARLRLAVYHQNFFAIALRLDGKFFERHDKYRDKVEPLQNLKQRLAQQLLMPLSNFEDMTESQLNTRQMEDQLAANGFCIPKKLRDDCQLERNIDSLLDEVQQIYFSDKENITTQEEHQAFLILSYVHIILFACWKMDVSILEALCKDDKDRGNVIKTILKLHFLYITGQINHETLTAVLTHVLARPFILQKAPIIDSRLVLLERVIPFIKAAHERVPVPPTLVFGKPVENASYLVAKPAGQTILPSNDASRTLEEYRAFLENPSPIPIVCNGNLIEELSGNCYTEGRRQDEFIQHTISAGAQSMTISVGGSLLKAPPGQQDDIYFQKGVHTSILTYLRDTCNLSEEDAWRISCAFQPSLAQVLRGQLNEIFTNRVLGISIKLDDQSLGSIGCGMNLTYENGAPKIKFDAIYNISDRNVLIAHIKVSLTMADARTGQAQFTYALV